MRIGLISYEYPPDTAVGGIATYMQQWARLLASRGHDVEVFCASPTRSAVYQEEGVQVNVCETTDRSLFKKVVVSVFIKRNSIKPFDIIESPEYGVDAKCIKQKFPGLRLVVKLHTPTFLMDELNNNRRVYSLLEKFRVIVGAYRRLKKPSRYWLKDQLADKEESDFIHAADIITSPSRSLIDIVARKFNIPVNRINHLPNPYIPSQQFLGIKADSRSTIITYFGRLEKRKGILLFNDIIPAVIAKHPNAIFRFVGRDTIIFPENLSARWILEQKLSEYKSSLLFQEHISLPEIPALLSDTRICIFPSLWENFPTVCLEAMSAGLPIVGSKNGGMKDMLESPKGGLLIDPLNAAEVSAAICSFLESEELCGQLGNQARLSVLEKYNAEVIGAEFEKIVGV